MRVPGVTVYIEKKSGDWLIQSSAIDAQSRFTVATGSPVRIPADAVETLALHTIINALRTFGEVKDPAPSSIDHLPRRERDYFYDTHQMIHIAQPKSDVIEAHLMRREAGGFIGHSKRRINGQLLLVGDQLIAAIRKLAGNCTPTA
jgi:hypothetical protein